MSLCFTARARRPSENMPKKIEYRETDEFQKDFRRLAKRFRSLSDDLETAKQNAIELFHLRDIDNRSVFPIPDFCSEKVAICKLKKFACKSLKGRGVQSGIRIIYAFYKEKCIVECIEIYFKGDQAVEDKERIKRYMCGAFGL